MCDDGGSSEADSEEMMFAVTDVRQVWSKSQLNLKFSSNIPMDLYGRLQKVESKGALYYKKSQNIGG